MLLFVSPDRQERVREKLDSLVHIPFGFERLGSQIIFYEPERDYSAAERDRDKRFIGTFRELR